MTDNIIRSNVGGDSTFIDYDNLHPINETAAALQGGGAGAITGAFLAGAYEVLMANDPPHLKGEEVADKEMMKSYKNMANSKANRWITGALVVVPAVIGAVKQVLSAQTHNQWSARVLNQMENKKSETGVNEQSSVISR